MPHDKSKHQCTMHGLHEWFEAKFKKLGWMALAKEHGHDLSVSSYLESISHLKACIKDKWTTVHDIDRKDDLKIMLDHTQTLMDAAHKLLASKMGEPSKHKKHHSNEEHNATFYGLHKWETTMFEKLGWMVLAKNEGNTLKIKSYMDTIHRLKDMLMKKIDQVQEKDRKDDLKILHDDACILWRAAAKLLGKPDCMKSNNMDSKHMIVHSDEAEHGMVMKMDNKGKKHMSIQSSQSQQKHNKPRHTRKDRYATKKGAKKNAIKKTLSNMMGGFF